MFTGFNGYWTQNQYFCVKHHTEKIFLVLKFLLCKQGQTLHRSKVIDTKEKKRTGKNTTIQTERYHTNNVTDIKRTAKGKREQV